jgi:DNA repair ATPase RecN
MKNYTIENKKDFTNIVSEIYDNIKNQLENLQEKDQRIHLFNISFEWLTDTSRLYNSSVYYPSKKYNSIRDELKSLYDKNELTDDDIWNVCIKILKNKS